MRAHAVCSKPRDCAGLGNFDCGRRSSQGVAQGSGSSRRSSAASTSSDVRSPAPCPSAAGRIAASVSMGWLGGAAAYSVGLAGAPPCASGGTPRSSTAAARWSAGRVDSGSAAGRPTFSAGRKTAGRLFAFVSVTGGHAVTCPSSLVRTVPAGLAPWALLVNDALVQRRVVTVPPDDLPAALVP